MRRARWNSLDVLRGGPRRRVYAPHYLRDGTRTLQILDEHLRTQHFMVSNVLSIADLALYSYVHRAEEGGFSITQLSGLRRWLDRIAARPRHISIDTVPAGS